MAEFSLALNEDQIQIQKWVHDFAENVVRPAGHEWDEREETPVAHHRRGRQDRAVLVRLLRQRDVERRHGPHVAAHARRVVLGRRRHRPVDLRLRSRRRRHREQRYAGADPRVGAAVLRYARRDPARRVLRERARRRFRRVVAQDARRLRRGQRRVGAQRHQGVDHQRRHRRAARRCRRCRGRTW